jgi:4-amino-4-deoxy-L-arabinose transferase-like glycosyltransferase
VPQRLRLPILIALGAVVFLAFLGQRHIVTSHEARVAQTAREMADSGWPWSAKPVATPTVGLVDTREGKRLRPRQDKPPLMVNPWLVPLIDSQVRIQKPPLPYWVVAATYRLTGTNETAARLGSGILGLLCVPLVYDLARRLLGRRAGWIAALVWISSYFMADEFRKAMADPYLAFFTLLGFWSYVRYRSEKRDGSFFSPSVLLAACARWPIPLFYLAIALGLLAKGPVLLAHLAIAIAAYHLCFRPALQRPTGPRLLPHLFGLCLLLLITLPWPLYVVRHVPNAIDLWRYESLGELTGENIEKARPWHFYLPNLFQLSLPWTAFWLAALVHPFLRSRLKHQPLRRYFPLLWYGGTIAFFSFSGVKKNAYLLPMMPAQVLLITQAVLAVLAVLATPRKPDIARVNTLIVAAQKLIGLGFGIAIAALILLNVETWAPAQTTLPQILASVRHARLHVTGPAITTAALALAAGLLPLLGGRSRTQLRRWFFAQGLCYCALLSLLFVCVEPPLDNARSPKRFAAAVARVATQPDYTLSHVRLPEPVLFYLPRNLPNNPAARHVLVVVEQRPKRPINAQAPAVFQPDTPGATPVDASEFPLSPTSPRNYWRLYDVTVKR